MLTPVMLTMLRHLSHETFKSGEEIAQRQGCSRASVHMAVKCAVDSGLVVHAVRGRGYRLATPMSWLDQDALAGQLQPMGIALKFFDTLDSTNSYLLSIAQTGAAHRTLVATEAQTEGRGRRGRRWLSGLAGGLTFSFLWRSGKTIAELSGLSLAVGVLLARALREMGLDAASVKWPNDIVLNLRGEQRGGQGAGQYGTPKLAGVLIELSGDMLSPATAVIGVGLNISGADALGAEIEQQVTDMAEHVGHVDRNAVLVKLVQTLDAGLHQFEQEGFAAFQPEWEACHAFQGQEVDIINALGERIRGCALGVDATGALRLGTASGERRFHSGEVSLRGVTP